MPTDTFYRLPEEKRARIIRSAQDELARVPYSRVSISRIALGADVSRSSLYQYFADQEDIFFLVMHELLTAMLQQLHQRLQLHRGDLFAALVDMLPLGQYLSENEIRRDLCCNVLAHLSEFQQSSQRACWYGWLQEQLLALRPHIDLDALDVRTPQDYSIIADIALGQMLFYFGAVTQDPDALPSMQQALQARYDLLKRGFGRKAPHSPEKQKIC